jgi:cytoskeleton protein RodZ
MTERSSALPHQSLLADDTAAARVGAQLRQARAQRGEEVAQIAASLRINPAYLAALESGDLGKLPGRPYAIGYLRSYARHLGIDEAACVDLIRSEVARAAPLPQVRYTAAIEGRRTTAVASLSLLLVGVLYGGYFLIYRHQEATVETVATVSGELGRLASEALSPEPGKPDAAAPKPAEPATALQIAADSLPSPAATARSATPPASATFGPWSPVSPPGGPPASPPSTVAVAETSVAPPPRTEADPSSPPDPTQANAAQAGGLLAELQGAGSLAQGTETPPLPNRGIALVAIETSWVQIESASRDFVRTRTLQAGERLILPERNDLALWTGNAGGLQIVLEGNNLGVVGERGQVVREIKLDPAQLRLRRVVR